MINAKRQITTETMIDYYLDVYERTLKPSHQNYAIAMIQYHLKMADYPHWEVFGTLE